MEIEQEILKMKELFRTKWTPKRHRVFEPTNFTDVILLVEDQRIHFNKALLSMHSEFFNALFNSDFKEKSMEEIPIEDVDYDDFAHLLAIIHPDPEFPNDYISEKLLELADRFMMPAVTKIVENLFMRATSLENSYVLYLADRYKMSKLFNKCLGDLKTIQDVKNVKNSIDCINLSDAAKIRLLDLVCSFD